MTTTTRPDNRKSNQLRPVKVTSEYIIHPPGSVLFEMGQTKVLVTVSIENGAPFFQREKGEGWLTAEYSMLPNSTNTRMRRERTKVSGRTMEIQRLIGRAMRMAVDLKKLGDRTITIDADVIQADGGTRTASITGAYIALKQAVIKGLNDGLLDKNPLKDQIAAVSVGVYKGTPVLDLNYIEDSNADVDMNVVMTGQGKLVEIQGTAESEPFDKATYQALIDLAEQGLSELFAVQRETT